MHSSEHSTYSEYILSFQQGEEKGFSFFFNEYYHALCLFCFRIIDNFETTEEIVGDSFIKAWERHSQFDHPKALKSFLYITCKNACFNWLYLQKKTLERKSQFVYLTDIAEKNILHHIIASETYMEIHKAINTLPPECRKIFRMLFIEGKNSEQVADELRLSVSTIRNQKARALMLIRRRISIQ